MTPPHRESLLWTATSLCVAVAIIFGSALSMHNINQISPADVVRPLTVLTLTAALITFTLMALWPQAGRLFPALLYSYFAFFNYQQALPEFGYEHLVACLMLPIPPLALHAILRVYDPPTVARYALAMTAAVALFTLILKSPTLFYTPPPTVSVAFHDQTLAAVENDDNPRARPDIIYLVPDRYPSMQTLTREYGVDNSPFYEALRARGFTVNENAHANYPKTFQSLASTFGGGYLDNFTHAYGTGNADQRPVYSSFENNVVQERLRQLGYRFQNYGGWWEPTRTNSNADVNRTGSIAYDRLSAFERLLITRTPARNAVIPLKKPQSECHRIQRKLRLLEEVGNEPAPIFAFVHVMVPHGPFTMDAAGNCLSQAVHYTPSQPWNDYKAAFAAYLQYFNTAALRIFDRQMKRRQPDGRKLLFVIQSDEGPFPLALHRTEPSHDFTVLTQHDLQMKMGTLNALRLPPPAAPDHAAMATPVNNWRIIFNHLLGTNLAMLPHRIYIFPSRTDVYRHCDVTDVVTGRRAAPEPCPPPQPPPADAPRQ